MTDIKKTMQDKANNMENKAHEMKGKLDGHIEQKKKDMKSDQQ